MNRAYYASPTGGGDGCSQSSPFRIADFWPVAEPGDTLLLLLDGKYTGPDSMINPPEGLKGRPDTQITVQALNEGMVEIDGESQRAPMRLRHNDYFVLEGFNAHHSSGSVVELSHSNHCAVRRVCGWDAADDNTNIFGVHHGEHNLVEDCAGWGVARKTFSCSQNGNYTTFRRCWGRWEGCTNVGPKMVMTVSYNSHHTLVENCIGAWDGRKMPESYTVHDHGEPFTDWKSSPKVAHHLTGYAVDQPCGIFGTDTVEGPGVRLLGCMAYRTADQRIVDYIAHFFIRRNEGSQAYMEHCVAFVEAGAPPVRPFALTHVRSAGLTAIGGKENRLEACSVENLVHLERPDSLVEGSGHILRADLGATVFYRYVDGQLTDEPLWPWPMNDRIKALIGVDVTRTVFELGGGTLPDRK